MAQQQNNEFNKGNTPFNELDELETLIKMLKPEISLASKPGKDRASFGLE